mmetsp:Transcript_30900/g.71206  ORF Transcript_30900/g.71206 Transcript_30900/m.71206 type:complete len:813 (+) Transcript_30900:65-2503(+)
MSSREANGATPSVASSKSTKRPDAPGAPPSKPPTGNKPKKPDHDASSAVTSSSAGHVSIRGEQSVIEETLMATHSLILHQRDESEIEQANLWEAERLRKAHELENDLLIEQQKAAAIEVMERAETKKMHLRMCAALKAHQRTIHQLERAQQLAVAAREKQDFLRQGFQKKMQHRLERQEREQKNLLQSQKRMQRNLLALQKLENMNLDAEQQKQMQEEQKLGARHLAELQKKEAEQLREVEALQGKAMSTNFEFELKCAWQEEVMEAQHVSAIIQLELQQTAELEAAKENARASRSLLKAAQLHNMQDVQAKQLRKKQKRAADSLRRSQARKAQLRRKAFEIGQEVHMYDVLVAAGTNSSATGSMSRSSRNKTSQGTGSSADGSSANSGDSGDSGDAVEDEEAKEDAAAAKNKDAQDRNVTDNLLQADKDDLSAIVLKNEQSVEDLRASQQSAMAKLGQLHKQEKSRLRQEWGDTAQAIKDREEAEFKALKLQHAQEKEATMQAHAQEREAMLRAFHLDKQMEKMRQEDAGNRAKGEFLQYVCHELRNPLTAVFGLCNFMLSDDSELSFDNVELLLSQARVMNCIVDDVLDLNKVQEGKLKFEEVPFDLPHLLGIIVDEMRMFRVAADKHVTIALKVDEHLPRFLKSDPSRLRQVTTNLLSNAVKFCTADGLATLLVKVKPSAPQSPGRAVESVDVYFEVTDNGIGVKPDELPQLFKPFSQLRASHHREYGGSGLGLSICKGLVESMGGKIDAKPLPKGACFWFYLPMKIATEAEQQVLVMPRRAPQDTSSVAAESSESAESESTQSDPDVE